MKAVYIHTDVCTGIANELMRFVDFCQLGLFAIPSSQFPVPTSHSQYPDFDSGVHLVLAAAKQLA